MSLFTARVAIGTVGFKYDPFGRRIYKSSSAATSIYAYDDDNVVEETNASGTVVARYAQTESMDDPLAMLRSATTSYYAGRPGHRDIVEQCCWCAGANLHVRLVRKADGLDWFTHQSIPVHEPGVRRGI